MSRVERLVIYFILFLMVGIWIQPNFVLAASLNPKLYNHFIRWDVSDEQARELSKWDVVTLDMEVQHTSPNCFKIMRELNSDIKILAYITSEEITNDGLPIDYLRQQLKNSIDERWWLKDRLGNKLSQWPGTQMLNMNSGWVDYLANFVSQKIMSSGFWDGIFYDNVWQDITWVNSNIDIYNKGSSQTVKEIDSLWQQGVKNLLTKTRNLIGYDKLIIYNGNGNYYTYADGKIFESFPTPWEGGNWSTVMTKYHQAEISFNEPNYSIILADTNNSGENYKYKKMRFGLTSTLMEDGYFAFDYGTQDHSQLWWYDEYNVNLGSALGTAKNLLNKNFVQYEPGVWQRDFENGIALVNSTNKNQTITLDGAVYEKIKGTQDLSINNGQLVNTVTLEPEDGLILLRQLNILKNIVYKNGVFSRIFDTTGALKRAGFYIYDPSFVGGVSVVTTDINNDGADDKIFSDNSKIKIISSGGNLVSEFYPYGKNYRSGINFTVGNLVGDGRLEIITGTGAGAGPQVRIFDSNGQLIHPGFFAFDKNFRGGVSVAMGDINADGYMEIIAGAGKGMAPQVSIFNRQGKPAGASFLAYDKNFKGGVNVAVGDLNGDKKSEIITGAGVGGGPHVRIFNEQGKSLNSFFAFDKSKRLGVKVSVGDADGDGKMEILASE